MYNQLQLKRTADFIWGRLAFVVTPSEYREFIDYCEANGVLGDCPKVAYYTDSPGPIEMGHACLFYRYGRSRILTWACPVDGDKPPEIERVPFALMHDSQGIEPTKPAVVEGKFDNIKDWGVSKVEARHQLCTLEIHIRAIRNLLEAMEETRQNIKSLIGTE